MCALSVSYTAVFVPFFVLINTFLSFESLVCVLGLTAKSFFFLCFSFTLGKIEVKILTRKNAEEAGDQWLTEEDTKSFRELLINLLVTEVVSLLSLIGFF